MEGITLKKFSGSQADYLVWRRQFNATMVLKELGYISSAKKLPIGKDQTEKAKIDSDNLKIYSYLCLTLDQQNAAQIELKCSQDGWAALQQISAKYEQKSILHSVNLKTELGEKGGDMEQYLLAIRLKVNQINEIEGGTFSEPAIIATIFTGLPESFQQWVFSTTAMKPNLSDVEEQLRSIGTYKRDRANTLGSGSGTQQDPIVLQASGKPKKFKGKPPGRASAPQPKFKPKQPGNKMHIKCFGCGKMGHYKSECRSSQPPVPMMPPVGESSPS